MGKQGIHLIQGPPGTGKTHTIASIVAMLLYSGVRKILICTPSNAAIDEVLRRLSNPDEILAKTQHNDTDLTKLLLRIGASEYKPDSELLKYTLDYKVKVLSGEMKLEQLTQEYELVKKLQALTQKKKCEGGKQVASRALEGY